MDKIGTHWCTSLGLVAWAAGLILALPLRAIQRPELNSAWATHVMLLAVGGLFAIGFFFSGFAALGPARMMRHRFIAVALNAAGLVVVWLVVRGT